jgi:fatty-acyl-CoA synthase
VIVQHPAIAEVAVIGVFDPKWGEVGRAIVVPRGDQEMSLAQITEHCQQYLARYKIPKSLVVLPELPRNTTGKVDKKILRAVHGIRREP